MSVAVDVATIECERDTNDSFTGSSDSLGIGQLLSESRNCDLQLVDLVNEAVLHLEQAEQSMQTNSALTHYQNPISSCFRPRAIISCN